MKSTKTHSDPVTDMLKIVIRWSVKALAVLMTFVIVMGVIDVIWTLHQKMTQPPLMLLQISDILATFGAFMAVLIAIEIFVNITIYLRKDVIHVKIVMATALMAIARKEIILDIRETEPTYLLRLGGCRTGNEYRLLGGCRQSIAINRRARGERRRANRRSQRLDVSCLNPRRGSL